MSEPAWAQPSRPYVPSHLLPGSARSSFAKPDEYNLQSPQPSAGSPSIAVTASDASRNQTRSGFASRPKLRSKRLPSAGNMPEDELPPVLSIRSASNATFGGDQDMSTPSPRFGLPVPSASANSNGADSTGVSVTVFGFPPGSSAEVLQFFGRMGEIIDNASSADASGDRSSADRSNLVECGRNWLRITFKDRQSAQTALAHNGHIMPGQYVIGCVVADQGELGGVLQQSSTNSLLLDDSDLSLLHEHSLAAGDLSTDRFERNGERASKNGDDSPLALGKIVPVELSKSSHLFKEPETKKNVPQVAEFTSTPGPDTNKQPKNAFSRVVDKVTDLVFGWDV